MRLTIALTTTLAMLLPFSTYAEQPAQGFRILSPTEIVKYREELENLHGAEREKYRNQVYAQLRQRAWQHGYDMPAKPPWWGEAPAGEGARSAEAQPVDQGAPVAQTEAPTPQSAPENTDMPKLIAQEKQVIEEATQADSQSGAASPPASGAANTPAAAAYRQQMRRRFDDFMARREERRRQLEEEQRARWQNSLPPYAQQQMQPHTPVAPPTARAQPAYPQPMQPQQPAYPQPMQPPYPMPQQQPAYPGYTPYPYPQRAPGWY